MTITISLFGSSISEAYYFVQCKSSGKVLDMKDNSMNNGGYAIQYNHDNTDSQKWYFKSCGNGYYFLKNKRSGKYLDVKNNGTSAGSYCIQYHHDGTDSQKWKAVSCGNGYYYFKNKRSGLYLNIKQCSGNSGQYVWTWHYTQQHCQKFKLTPCGGGYNPPSNCSWTNSCFELNWLKNKKDNDPYTKICEYRKNGKIYFKISKCNSNQYYWYDCNGNTVNNCYGGQFVKCWYEGCNTPPANNCHWTSSCFELNWLKNKKDNDPYTKICEYRKNGKVYFKISKCNSSQYYWYDCNGNTVNNCYGGQFVKCWYEGCNTPPANNCQWTSSCFELQWLQYKKNNNPNTKICEYRKNGKIYFRISSCNTSYFHWYDCNGNTINGLYGAQFVKCWYEGCNTGGGNYPPGNGGFDGYYSFKCKNSGKALDMKDNSMHNGGYAIQHHWDGTNSQKWEVKSCGNGYYFIKNKRSGKYLDVKNNSTSAGGYIIQYHHDGTDSQKWKLVDCGNGYYYVKNKRSGLYLNVKNCQTNSGAYCQQWHYTQQHCQKWKIDKINYN